MKKHPVTVNLFDCIALNAINYSEHGLHHIAKAAEKRHHNDFNTWQTPQFWWVVHVYERVRVCVLFLIALLGIWFWQVADSTAPTLPPPLDTHAHLTIFNFPLKFVRIFWIFKSCATESNRQSCAEIYDYGHTDKTDRQHFNISRDFRWHIVNRSNRTNRSQHTFEMRQKESGELYSSNDEAAAAAPILCTCESKQLIAKRQRMTETAQKIEYSIQILYVCVHNIYAI